MARLVFPDDRMVVRPGTAGAAMRNAAGLSAVVYADLAGTVLADIQTTSGQAVAGSTLVVDAYSQLPLFLGPDGADAVWVTVAGGPLTPVYARVDDRLDDLAGQLAGKADDAAVVHKTGDETIGGKKSFSESLRAADLPALVPVSRRPLWRPASWSQQLQAGHTWTASSVASSTLNDTSAFVRGTQSMTITTVGTGGRGNFRGMSLPSTPLDLTGKMLRIIFRVDDVTHLNRIDLYLGTGGLANYFLWTIHTHSASGVNYAQSGEWVTVHLQWADVLEAAGTYTLSAGLPSTKTGFTDMQLSVWDDAAGPVTARLQAVEVIPDTTATFPNGVVSVTFDDGYASQYTLARPKMDALGYRGTAYMIADVVGTGGVMSLTQLQSLQAYSGWEIAGHAYANASHSVGFHALTSVQVNQDFRQLRSWLVSNGFTSDNFAYPLGHFDATTDGVPVDKIASQYWATSRSIITEGAVGSFPPAMPQRVRAKTGISEAGTSVATITAAGGPLDRCKASGSWYIICLHDITAGAGATSTQLSQAGFNTLMDAISSRGIPVLPVGDVMRYYT